VAQTFSKDNLELQKLGQNLASARVSRGLSQKELASLCRLSQAQISYFEGGRRWPTLLQLTKLAEVLEVPLNRLLSGPERPAVSLQEIAFELRNLGIVDLSVGNAPIPGAFRPVEQIISLALAGDEPEPRIVEAIPAVLAWNTWRPDLLRAYARAHDPRVVSRVAWLADIALTIDRTHGFPGGVQNGQQLSRLLKLAKPARHPDDLGRPAAGTRLPPVSKRWNITYAANLATFLDRAKHLHALKNEGRFWRRTRRLPIPSRVNRSDLSEPAHATNAGTAGGEWALPGNAHTDFVSLLAAPRLSGFQPTSLVLQCCQAGAPNEDELPLAQEVTPLAYEEAVLQAILGSFVPYTAPGEASGQYSRVIKQERSGFSVLLEATAHARSNPATSSSD
jgi:transcriptional regulator with XRE-family HTH domain